ncbi:MAG: NADH-quinone oxidoreductase subunit H, partial [Thermoproteota archaeon]
FVLGHGLPPAWSVLKALFIVFLFEFVEAVCARLRIDQVVRANWKLMVPISLLSLALVSFCVPLAKSATGGA